MGGVASKDLTVLSVEEKLNFIISQEKLSFFNFCQIAWTSIPYNSDNKPPSPQTKISPPEHKPPESQTQIFF